MYHPAHAETRPENTSEEFLELYNPTESTIDLEGFRFTRGIDFTFPADTRIEPRGFLVIAADPGVFANKYGSDSRVVGGWTGRLSNSGEEILLRNKEGDEVDSVSYHDQGDWARRTRQNSANRFPGGGFRGGGFSRNQYSGGRNRQAAGLAWVCKADGLGCSLELINPYVSNDSGQNW
ncbi:MAG: lamin tail domain-containing protein, partial [Verrucomicrobiota bacterium]